MLIHGFSLVNARLLMAFGTTFYAIIFIAFLFSRLSLLFHLLGMPLTEIVRASTITPAKAYGLAKTIGSLGVGKEADVTVLRIDECDVMLEDCQAQIRNLKKRIIPVAVWRAGTSYPVTLPDLWPNIASRKKIISEWYHSLIVKDDKEPTL